MKETNDKSSYDSFYRKYPELANHIEKADWWFPEAWG